MALLDEKDLVILKAMRVYPFNGLPHGPDGLRPAALAKRTGLNIDLIKDRIARMERQGLIAGYQIYPNLRHLGLHEVVLHISVPVEARARFFAVVEEMAGVAGVSRFVGESACIDLTYSTPADLRRKTDALVGLAGIDTDPDPYVQLGANEPARRLGHLDWRIIAALRGKAKRPLADIARDLGVTQRTVRRRLQAMDDDGSIDVVVEPDLGAVSGAIMYVVRVTCMPSVLDATLAEVVKLTRHRSFSVLHPTAPEQGAFMVDGFAFTQREVDDARSAIAALPGVNDVELLHPSSVTASTRWLDDAIQDQVARTSERSVSPEQLQRHELQE